MRDRAVTGNRAGTGPRSSGRVMGGASLALVLGVSVVGCSGSDGGDDNQLDRIDGPAQVDPDYDPLGTGGGSGDVEVEPEEHVDE